MHGTTTLLLCSSYRLLAGVVGFHFSISIMIGDLKVKTLDVGAELVCVVCR